MALSATMPKARGHGIEGVHGLKDQIIGPSGWREVTQEMVNQFAELSGDDQWIHVDVERAAAESPFGTTVAHGNLTLSLVAPEEVGIEFAPLPFGTIMLRVPDVEAAKAELQEAGVEFLGETWDSGVCHGAVFRDPDGNSIGLHHRYAPYLDGTTP